VPEPAVREFEAKLGIQLPDDYVTFLVTIGNGGNDCLGEGFVQLWRLEEVTWLDETYAPGALQFASDGGNEAYAFDTRSEPMSVVMIPLIGYGWDDAVLIGSFTEFIEKVYAGTIFDGITDPKSYVNPQ